MLGANGKRVYFIAFTTPTEARGSGGFMGNWAEVTFDKGHISVTGFGRTVDLIVNGDTEHWVRITSSPNFPDVAKLIADGYSMNHARELARPWIQRVGLGKREAHLPERLSMGERQRVAIARALVNKPKLLLMDEPTGNLDSKRSREILTLLREVCHERQIPGILVTHDPQASSFVDHVHTLRDGEEKPPEVPKDVEWRLI